MSYTALYRKYRPDTFDEVIGQEHVVTTLKNQVRTGRVSHAYLFTGARGTGKTSVAKILAKAVNCEEPQDGNPCGHCAACRAIARETALNVVEIDAASNNSVDNVRQIREEVAYPPTEGKYRVYIVDEVHMLSNSAFNALLKTLEEPPGYVIFILATTEVHKIPVTILSRCQRYDFRRISQEEIVSRLKVLFEKEQVEADEKALRFIAAKAEGGMRDALSLADQCIAFYLNEPLTYEKVLDVLGAVDTQVLGKLFRSICASDVAAVFSILEDMLYHGRELTQLAADFTEYLRDLLLIRSVGDAQDILEVSEDSYALLREEAAMTDEETLLRDIRIFSDLSTQMRLSSSRRVLLEVALIRLCKPQMETDLTSLAVRLRTLEERLENGAVMMTAIPDSTENAGRAAPAVAAARGRSYQKAASDELRQIDEQWNEIIEPLHASLDGRILKRVRRMFDTSDPDEDILYLVGSNTLTPDIAGSQEQIRQLEDLIEARIGKRIRVRMMNETQEEAGGQPLEEIRKHVQDILSMPVDLEPGR